MKKIVFFSLFILLLKIIYIKNNTNLRRNQDMENYDLFNITNIKCDKSNYTTSFKASVCGKAQIITSQFFAFKIPDTKNNNHSIHCSIIIGNSERKLDYIHYSNNSVGIDDNNSELENYTDEEEDTKRKKEKFKKIKIKENKLLEDNSIESDTIDFIDNSNEYETNSRQYTTTSIKIDEDYLNNNMNIESTLITSNTEDIIPSIFEKKNENTDFVKTNEYSDIETNNYSIKFETINDSIDIEKTNDYKDISELESTILSTIEETIPSSLSETIIPSTNTETIIPNTHLETSILSTNIETTIRSKYSENYISTINTEITIPLSNTENIIQSTLIETNTPSTNIETTISSTHLQTTIPSETSETAITFNNTETIIPSPHSETATPSTNVETTIQSTYLETSIQTIIQNETEIIIDPTNSSNHEFCYESICSIKGMIREAFQIKIEDYFPIYIEEIPKDIFILPSIPENTVYKVDKCYLIKNIFKQVLKFKVNNSRKEISFLLVSMILGKVEKNEELIAEIILKKKEKNLRNLDISDKNTANCKSLYNVEPVEGKEILNCYNCIINNIDKPDDYSGLIFDSSLDVKNIPNNSNLTDPAITDSYIKQGKIQDFSLLEFSPINLDINNCEKTSQFKILGNLSKELNNNFYFNIFIFLSGDKNTTSNCSLPGGIRGEINMTCQVYNYFYNSFINIPSHIINGEDDEPILNITAINYHSNVTCKFVPVDVDPIVTDIITEIVTEFETENETESENITQEIIISELIDSEIIFRQISHLKINSEENKINFYLVGFTFNNLKKNSYMPIPINLIKLDDIIEEKNSTCILNMDISHNLNELTPLIFYCEILNIEGIEQVIDIKIISSPLIKNIKTGYTDIVFAKKTDDLINDELLLDYLKEENLYKVPPVLKNPIIHTFSCNNDGIFDIQGIIDASIEKNISFYLELIEVSIDSRCKIPATEANKNIIIKCNTMESFTNIKIQIESKIIYDMDYNEIFYLNYTESINNVICKNNNQIKLEEANQKLKAIYSFRQASNFKKEYNSNKYQFFLATFTKGEIGINAKIVIKVRIKSENQNKIKSYKKRKLSRTEEKSAECSISMKSELDENGIGVAGWTCTTKESSINDATGLDIIGSEEISGIPNHPNLIDPAKTDILIEKGEMKDFSIEENLNEILPVFNILAMNYSLCRHNGTFFFTGNMTSTIINDILFDLNITYPETVFACRLPKSLKGQKVQIECINRDNFENSTLLVEETVIRDGYNEYFIFRNISSGDLLVTCSSSEDNVTQSSSNNDFKIIKKTVKDESSSGIGNAGIIVLIIVGSIAIFGIVMLCIFLKVKNPKIFSNDKNNSANSTTFNKNSSSSSFYY